MEKETINNILDFFLEKENMDKPFKWKLVNNEPLTKEELTIKGDLYLIDSDITSLPKGLKVGNSLNLMNCKNLISLPKGLKVGGYLDLGNCTSLTSLPEGLKIGAFLNLKNCTNLTSLPEGLKVYGLNLTNCTSLTSLPEGLKVNGFLNIGNTKLAKYSDDELKDMIKPNGYIQLTIFR
jgi:hypothetical protein